MENDEYKGFEQGPIRPPSEALSLLLRITRNCPWNKCTFCSIYKNKNFSLRPLEDIIKDIDLLHTYINGIMQDSDIILTYDVKKIDSLFTYLIDTLSETGQLSIQHYIGMFQE